MPSPLELEIALHYACRADDFRGGDFSFPAVKAALGNFVALGLLRAGDALKPQKRGDPPSASSVLRKGAPSFPRAYEPTDGLKMWVEALCAVQPPTLRQQWVMPEACAFEEMSVLEMRDSPAFRAFKARCAAEEADLEISEKAGPEWGGPEWRKNPFGTAYTAAVRDFAQFDPARNVPGRGILGQA